MSAHDQDHKNTEFIENTSKNNQELHVYSRPYSKDGGTYFIVRP